MNYQILTVPSQSNYKNQKVERIHFNDSKFLFLQLFYVSCILNLIYHVGFVDGTSIGYWEDLSGTKHYYYTGKEGEGCACSLTQSCAGGSTTKCNCDINDSTLRSVGWNGLMIFIFDSLCFRVLYLEYIC